MDAPFILHRGAWLAVAPTIPDSSIDAIVIDPPYELGFMGRAWDKTGMANDVATWREALRVLKPGGHLLAFSGTRTYHRMVCAIEDAGFEIRDQIGWAFGTGFPKSADFAGYRDDYGVRQTKPEFVGHPQSEGWGTAIKPAWEPICMARKPITSTVAANVLAHGTGALNIDGCRVEGGARPGRTNAESRSGLTGTGGANTYGAYAVRGSVAVEDTTLGRWPANLLHDGSEEVLAAFPDAKGQQGQISTTAPSEKTSNVYGRMRREGEASAGSDNDGAVGFKMKPGMRRLDSGSAARFFYCAKASRSDRNEGLADGGPPAVRSGATMRQREDADWSDRNGNHHPTVKPTDLMRYLVRLVTPPGGTVLDFCMGSGSTGKACMLEGFRFIGVDMDSDEAGNPIGYMDIARARITHAWREVAAAQREVAAAERAPKQFDLLDAAD